MPTVVRSSSQITKLGDLSTYNISTAAIPYDTSDTSGAVPTVGLVMAQGTDVEYLIDETLTIKGPALGAYEGGIVEVSNSATSAQYGISANTILSRLNSDQRMYPDNPVVTASAAVPLAALEYWSQQCGIFYDKVQGDVLFYQSMFTHWFAFVKGTTRPIRGRATYSADPGEAVALKTIGNRYVTTFGKNRDVSVAMPATAPLTVQIPAPADPKRAVFSSNVLNTGTGRKSTITWNFVTPTKRTVAMRVVIDSAAGISVESNQSGGTFVSRGAVAAAIAGTYHIDIGVTSATATTSTVTLNVLDTAGALVGTASATFTTILSGSLSLTNIVYRGEDQGSDTVMTHWGNSISIMAAMPTAVPFVQKSLTPGTKTAALFSGFSGNVWENVKAYCSIFHLDVSCVNSILTIAPRATVPASTPVMSALGKQINTRDKARFVEVVCQNSSPTVTGSSITPKVMWKADSVYEVAVGASETFTVQTDHSILELSQPVAVSGITPFPYVSGAGQYVVTGSDGYIVSPAFWRAQGGLITVDTTDNEGEIKVTIKGPDFDSPRAPYRISEGDAGRPALYVTGQGIINKPKTIRVSTGNTTAAKELGDTIESPFISSPVLAYDAAARASRKFATPDVQVSLNESLSFDYPSNLGTVPAGQLIKRDGNILRITDATQTYASVSGTAIQHNTIALVKQSFAPGVSAVRTNYSINPRGVTATGWTYQLGTGEAATQTLETGAGPNGLNGFIRRTITTAKTGGSSGHLRKDAGIPAGVAGDVLTGSVWVRCSVAINIFVNNTFRMGTTVINGGSGTTVTLVPNVWTQLSLSLASTGAYDGLQVWAVVGAGFILPVGATLDATQMLIEKSGSLGSYFDGATPNTPDLRNAWTGTANASSSTQTPVSTIAGLKTFYAGKSIKQTNIKPLKVVK